MDSMPILQKDNTVFNRTLLVVTGCIQLSSKSGMSVADPESPAPPSCLPAQTSCLEAQPEHATADPVVVWELLDGACGDKAGSQGGVPGLYRDTWPCATPSSEKLPRAAQDRL